MNRLKVVIRLSGRTEDFGELVRIDPAQSWFTIVPGHLDARGVMDEIVEVEPNLVAHDADHIAHLGQEAGFAVGGEPHHLVLVSVLGESQKLGEGGVKQAQRVGEMNTALNVETISLPLRLHHTAAVAESVDRNNRRFLE